jgi:glycosyltransferase involved in cell wall biosynthesis
LKTLIELKEIEEEKKLILVLGDSPLSPSGVGSQLQIVIRALLSTGRYKFYCLGGAIKHKNYNAIKTEEFGDDLIIQPVDGYGTPDMIRSILNQMKPDMLLFMTDPRFFTWLWMIEHEIRPHIPMIYFHVWDNYPYPKFNKRLYESNDFIVTISKLTDDVVRTVAPSVRTKRLGHSVNMDIFRKFSKVEKDKLINEISIPSEDLKKKTIFFWNSRNARRKQSGTVIWWFKEFLNQVGDDKAMLIMHTDTKDSNGQDLDAIVHDLGLGNGQVFFSRQKIPQEAMAAYYNIADFTINISDAEGFGLSAVESLACETPIIVTMTGGLQEQVTDGEQFFGVGIEPSSKTIIGGQDVPYIYEDRISEGDFVDACIKMHNLSEDERQKLGERCREHVEKNYNFDEYCDNWVEVVEEVIEEFGSWETRKGYQSWRNINI